MRNAKFLEEKLSSWLVLSLCEAGGLRQHTVGHLTPAIASSGNIIRYQHQGSKPPRPSTLL
jgi:hypothetical protein